MTTYNPPVYIIAIKDVPGVAAANNFISIFNPVTSGRANIAIQTIISTYASASATVNQSMHVRRITAASGGTLVAAADIPRFATYWPNPTAEVRISNPTVTLLTSQYLTAFPPVISTGTGQNSASIANPPGASFLMLPGEGLVFGTDGGDTDQVWNLTYVWAER